MLLSMVIIACVLFCIRKPNDNFMAWLSKDILGYLVLVRTEFGIYSSSRVEIAPSKTRKLLFGVYQPITSIVCDYSSVIL